MRWLATFHIQTVPPLTPTARVLPSRLKACGCRNRGPAVLAASPSRNSSRAIEGVKFKLTMLIKSETGIASELEKPRAQRVSQLQVRMTGNLLDPDPEFRDLDIDELRVMVSRGGESVLRRGRAMMGLGRRASRDAALLQEVAEMIRAAENRRLVTVGTTSMSWLMRSSGIA
jgi:hypothetical protein